MWAILSTICDNGVRSLWWRRRWHECSGCWGTLQMQTKLCIMYCNDSLVMDEHVQALVKNEISLFSEHTDSISSVNVIQQFTFYWLASICIPPQPFRLDRRKHVGQVKVINKAVQRHQLLPHMRHTKPLWEVLGGCRLFVACGDHSSSVWRDVTCSSTSHDQYTHTHTLAFSLCFSPGWSELFISLSTSAASGEMLSLGHYKYPQAVENVLTDTGDIRGPPCCCLSAAAVWWCSQWPTFLSLRYFILDLMKSWITNLKPNRDRLILSHASEGWNTFNIYSKTVFENPI